LNSGDCFVLLTPGTMYNWQGSGSTDGEKEFAAHTSGVLQCGRDNVTVAEGGEPQEFWDAIGGQGEYASSSELVENPREPRLFVCSNASGKFDIEEIFNFNQDDLTHDDIFMLDSYTEVFVWVGADANKTEKDMSFAAALDYVGSAPDGRDSNTPVMQCGAGSEPPMFTQSFLGWDYAKAADFQDPYAAKVGDGGDGDGDGDDAPEQKTAPVAARQITRDDIGFKKGGEYSAEELRAGVDEIDPSRKESYLSDAEFSSLFGMDKDSFYGQAQWKQNKAKKAHKLF